LPIEDYDARGVLPDWRDLPTEKQYQSLAAVEKLENGISQVINRGDVDECVDLGWLEITGSNEWCLTKSGKKLLR
jgi:hypothetical protein